MTTLYKNLLDQFDRSEVNITKWIAASKEYFQTVIHADPILKQFSNKITIVLHGSTTRDVDTVIAEIKRNPTALSGPKK
ncbi:MAG: hypothetical protein JSW07_03835 [bacterium]|nr:MAG: hypothetical protein JSW07_03835 [bacterium]